MQGLLAMLGRIEGVLEKADASVLPAVSRRSSEVLTGKPRASIMMQSTLTKNGSMVKALEPAAGQKLHRLYTIDQDAFFPDLPPLVSVSPCKISEPQPLAGQIKWT